MTPTDAARPEGAGGSSRVRAREGRPGVPRFALTVVEAAEALGVSRDWFDEHVRPELAVIRRGQLILVPVGELERWVRASAERAL